MNGNNDTDIKKDIYILSAKSEVLENRVQNLEEVQKTRVKKSEEEKEFLSHKIDAVKEGINNRIDELDISFRGNGRIGVFEQIRNLDTNVEELKKLQKKTFSIIKWVSIIIFSVLVFVVGGEVAGLELQDLKDFFSPSSSSSFFSSTNTLN